MSPFIQILLDAFKQQHEHSKASIHWTARNMAPEEGHIWRWKRVRQRPAISLIWALNKEIDAGCKRELWEPRKRTLEQQRSTIGRQIEYRRREVSQKYGNCVKAQGRLRTAELNGNFICNRYVIYKNWTKKGDMPSACENSKSCEYCQLAIWE